MRLAVLDEGHRFATRALFAIIRAASRHPTPEALKLVMYRPEFYGTPMQKIPQDAMRGPSAWSVGDRELMAALISKMNACEYCIKAHTAVSAKAYRDPAKVSAALADLETAPLDQPLRATLRMLAKLTRENAVGADDMRAVLAAGVSREQIRDALSVAFVFNAMNRLAEAFKFEVGETKAFEAGARYLLARGYR
jgi:uncharacterized peroxidase-related enzyme